MNDDEFGDTGQRAHLRHDVWYQERALREIGERFRVAEGHPRVPIDRGGRAGVEQAHEISEALLEGLLHQLIVRDPGHFCGSSRSRGAVIVVMEATQDRHGHDLVRVAGRDVHCDARLWASLLDPLVRSRLVKIGHIGRKHTTQMALVQDDKVIEALAAHAAEESLAEGVRARLCWLPWSSVRQK